MNPEFLPNLSHEEYLAYPAVSRSMLMNMNKSPRHYWYEHISGKAEPIDTKPMQIGTALHALVIEADRFADFIAIVPDTVKRPTKSQINAKNPSEKTVEQIQWWEDFNKKNEGKIALTESEVAEVKEMADAILDEELAADILAQRGHTEATVIWTDEKTGLRMKYRSDFTRGDFKLGMDIKTCANAARKKFQGSIVDYGYDIQAFMWFEAMRALGHDPQEFKFTCVEKKPPFATGLYNADEEVLRSGEIRYNELLDMVLACQNSGKWPSYTPEFEDVGMPGWYMYQLDGLEDEIKV